MIKRLLIFCVLVCAVCSWPQFGYAEIENVAQVEQPCIIKKVALYIPNRILDFLDMFKARVRVGPGVSVDVRVTEYGSFYVGKYSSVYLGFPGARYPEKIRSPIGIESDKGLTFMGIDATDDFKHDRAPSLTEVSWGVNLLLVGFDIGFDPFEMADFVSGLFFMDLRGDDIGSPLGIDCVADKMPEWEKINNNKPAKFKNLDARLEYLRRNLALGVDARVERFDAMFAGEDVPMGQKAACSQFLFGLYVEPEDDDGWGVGIDLDFSLDVDLPNLERKYSVYVTGRGNAELPGTNPTEREGGSRVGVTRRLGELGWDIDAGVKWDWPPVAYSGVEWARFYDLGDWRLRPGIRGFVESDDGWGQVTSFSAFKWLGSTRRYTFKSVSAGRWTEDTEGWEWEQSVSLGCISSLIRHKKRTTEIGKEEVANGFGFRYSVLGHADSSDVLDRHRITFAYRRPLYSNWVYLSVEPELEWVNEKDWDMITRLRIGFDALLWDVGAR